MKDLYWQVKELIRKLLPFVIVAAIAYLGFSVYQGGAFSGGIGPGINKLVSHIPFFGSRFKHFSSSPSQHYGTSRKYSRNGRIYYRKGGKYYSYGGKKKYRKSSKNRRSRRGRSRR